MSEAFFDWITRVMARRDSMLCVGLDPPLDLDDGLEDFGRRIIDKTVEHACCYKPNSAFYEARGAAGMDALIRTVGYAHEADTPVILDAKRGDIASTAEAYAAAAFKVVGADAVTLSPYLGADSVEPFTAYPGRGVFLLCHTSNPGAVDFQTRSIGEEPLYRVVARTAGTWKEQDRIGLVVGATYPAAIASIRATDPHRWLLLPGVGAQGGGLEGVRAACGGTPGHAIVNSSRSIILSGDPGAAARETRLRLNAARNAG